MADAEQYQVAIIGGGFSGIGTAIALDKAGFSDYVMIEEGTGVGGAWHWNTYPGVAVDIPSFSYQFSFEQTADWSRLYAPGEELRAYADHCVDKYDIRERTRCSTRIIAATFDDDEQLWRLDTAEGDTIAARFVIGATGVLTQPKAPDIEGISDFAGAVMHTARWDDSIYLHGKRVAVVGTGASAVQAIPLIAEQASQLTVFQRTPIWCMPKLDVELPRAARSALSVPGVKQVARLVSQTFVEITFPLAAHFDKLLPSAKVGEKLAHRYLKRAVKDSEVREKLTPKYALGCKRPSFSNEYLPTFNRENVTLETDPIEAITPTGVRTASGVHHDVDVLILATGFKVFERGNMPPFSVKGSSGLDLESFWFENRFQAYHGVSVPGFPNFFTILGPYGYNGSSYFNLIETQSAHIVRLLKQARRTSATRIEVTPEANARYFELVLSRRKYQVFFQDTCSVSNSYYFDEHGDVPLRPSPTLETMWDARHFPLDDYLFSETASATE